jgi:hypothetical protein
MILYRPFFSLSLAHVRCVFRFSTNDRTINFHASGEGGNDTVVEELLQSCQNGTDVFLSLFRVTEQIDASTTVKFCYAVLQPDNMPVMQKARLSTQQGELKSFFQPYHTEFYLENASELSSAKVLEHIGDLTGK